MAGVGSIHIDEIAATLSALENHLDIELQSNVLGSVGKKEFSGDIDVAVQMSSDQVESFMQNLLEIDIVEDVDRAPNLVMAKVKIIGYDSSKDGYNRTGFVQVDFMLNDDIEWLKTFYHSPAQNESKYKGAHRNIAVGALSKYVNPMSSQETTPDGRPLEQERFMFSPKDGLVRIVRRPKPKANGEGYTKNHTNDIVAGPWRTAQEIARQLQLGDADSLNSFETVFKSIEQNHGNKVAKAVANDMANDRSIRQLGLPTELEKYL